MPGENELPIVGQPDRPLFEQPVGCEPSRFGRFGCRRQQKQSEHGDACSLTAHESLGLRAVGPFDHDHRYAKVVPPRLA
jgi:hypothetical protein